MKPNVRSVPLSAGGRPGTYGTESCRNDLPNIHCATATDHSAGIHHLGRGDRARSVVKDQRPYVGGEGIARGGLLRWETA